MAASRFLVLSWISWSKLLLDRGCCSWGNTVPTSIAPVFANIWWFILCLLYFSFLFQSECTLVDTASQQGFHSFPSILRPKSQPIEKLHLATFTQRHSKQQLAGNNTEADARETQPTPGSPTHTAGLSRQGESRCTACQWKQSYRWACEPKRGTESNHDTLPK